jgi:hypothetical protein
MLTHLGKVSGGKPAARVERDKRPEQARFQARLGFAVRSRPLRVEGRRGMSERSDDERNDPGSAELPDALEAAYEDVFRLIDVTQSESQFPPGDADAPSSRRVEREEEDWPEPAQPIPGFLRQRVADTRRPSPATLRRRMRTALRTIDMAIETALDDPWGPATAAKPRKPSAYEGREF